MIPKVVLRPYLPDTSRRKHSSCGIDHRKKTTPPSEDEATWSSPMLLNYVPLRPSKAPNVTIGKSVKYQLVSLSIPKGIRVTTNIIPNLNKLEFIDHDLHNFLELSMERYMATIREMKDVLIHIVLMEWDRGLDKLGLLLFMHMPHFGCTI